MSEVRGRLIQQVIKGRIFGGVGAEQLAALFGRNAVVFLEASEDSLAHQLDFAPMAGSVLPNTTGNDTLFVARMPFAKPAEAGVTMRIAGITAEYLQLQTLGEDQIGDGAYQGGDYALIVRPGEANFAALTFFGATPGAVSGVAPFVPLAATEASTANYLQFAPSGPAVPPASGQGVLFMVRMPFARPAEGGIIIKIAGVNDAEPFQLQTPDGDQIPYPAWDAGDFGLIVRPGEAHFSLLQIFGQGGGEVVIDGADPYRAHNAAMAAARADQIAREGGGDGAGKQDASGNLTALAGLVGEAGKLAYFSGAEAMALTTLTAFGRSLIDDADAAAARTTLGLVIGANVQAYHANLASLAGLVLAVNQGLYATGAGTVAAYALTAAGRALVDDADAAAQRTTLGLGTLAIQNASAAALTGGYAHGLSYLQVTGSTPPPAGGSGIELIGGASATIQAYNRTGGAYISLAFDAATTFFKHGGAVKLQTAATGVAVTGSIKPSSYTVATAPSASTHGAGAGIYVTDMAGGAEWAFSDGTNWRRFSDRVVMS